MGIIGLGVLQFFAKDYIVGRPPSPAWSADIHGKIIWAYISGIFLIIAGLAIILKKKRRVSCIYGWGNDYSVFFFTSEYSSNAYQFMGRYSVEH